MIPLDNRGFPIFKDFPSILNLRQIGCFQGFKRCPAKIHITMLIRVRSYARVHGLAGGLQVRPHVTGIVRRFQVIKISIRFTSKTKPISCPDMIFRIIYPFDHDTGGILEYLGIVIHRVLDAINSVCSRHPRVRGNQFRFIRRLVDRGIHDPRGIREIRVLGIKITDVTSPGRMNHGK